MTETDYSNVRAFITCCGVVALSAKSTGELSNDHLYQLQFHLAQTYSINTDDPPLELKLLITSTRLLISGTASSDCIDVFSHITRFAFRWFKGVEKAQKQPWWNKGAMA